MAQYQQIHGGPLYTLSGRIAWLCRLRAILAEPPALSPSTMKISLICGSWQAQSASLPGNADGRKTLFRRTFTISQSNADQHSGLQSSTCTSIAPVREPSWQLRPPSSPALPLPRYDLELPATKKATAKQS
eukprot:scaffold1839_cov382-Prasinococcus_capsulatus_cf.AAC.11